MRKGIIYLFLFLFSQYSIANDYRLFLLGQYSLLNANYYKAIMYFKSLKEQLPYSLLINTALEAGDFSFAKEISINKQDGKILQLLMFLKTDQLDKIKKYFLFHKESDSFLQIMLSLVVNVSKNNLALIRDRELWEPVYRFYYAKFLLQNGRIREAHDFLISYQDPETIAESRLRLRLLEPKDLIETFFQQYWMQNVSIMQDIKLLKSGKILPPIFDNKKNEMAYWLIWHAENISLFRPQEALIDVQLALWLDPNDSIITSAVSVLYILNQPILAKKWACFIKIRSPYYTNVMLIIARNSSFVVAQHIIQYLLKLNSWGALALYTHFMEKKYPPLGLSYYNHAIAKFPNAGFLYIARGYVEERQKKWYAAERDFNIAQSLDHNDSSALLAWADLCIKRNKNVAQAILMLQDLSAQVNDPAAVYLLLGRAFEKIGYLNAARTSFLEAFSFQPLNWNINNALKKLAKKQGHVNEEQVIVARMSRLCKN